MNRTLTKKLIYVIAALTLLAMLIPAMTVPVSAAAPNLTMEVASPLPNGTSIPEGNPGWNVSGSIVTVYANDLGNYTPTAWTLINIATEPSAGVSPATWVGGQPLPTANPVQVQGIWGHAEIQLSLTSASGNMTLSIEKKWGQIQSTAFTNTPNYTAVTWNEATKSWSASATIKDTVTGVFYEKDENPVTHSHYVTHAAAGTILNWYLIPGNVVVDLSPAFAGTLKSRMEGYQTNGPVHVSFTQWPTPVPNPPGAPVIRTQNVTGVDGSASVNLYAKGEEAVQVVVVPEYPFTVVNIPITPELTSYSFYTTEMEVVPQVRWAGEKIVLEKNFGVGYQGKWVKFVLQNQSVGGLEGITGNSTVNGSTVWTQVDSQGFASCILVSTDAGVANVTAGLYNAIEGTQPLDNQHFFTVYFLKFEKITLGDVHGKRTLHNDGWWETLNSTVPTNPWDPTGAYNGALTGNMTIPDMPTQTLNVSQDALLRARVQGWFTSSNPSVRPVRTIKPSDSTLDNPTGATLTLPAGRWILPDDWADLAGPNWQQGRMHWDIMCNPYGAVTAVDPLGPYKLNNVTVAAYKVIGPFSPGLELMTPQGWTVPNPNYDKITYRTNMNNTVVPDGNLNYWDAPMPPAKIIFQIQNVTGSTNVAGFFKPANKPYIYYLNVSGSKVYTNPFYQAMIPAHVAIPVFINNGGYDWNSFDPSYGPYAFWKFINQGRYLPLVATSDSAGHPTTVEVYSDNHGEAMAYLNGNWNLDLTQYLYQAGTVDIPINAPVGTTTIQATADYPYSRVHQAIQSNLDVKSWLWGGQVLGTDSHTFPGTYGQAHPTQTTDTRMVLSAGTWDISTEQGSGDNKAAKSTDKVVWVWVTDRDGLRAGVDGARVDWSIATIAGSGAKIATDSGKGISQFNDVTKQIYLYNGFLALPEGYVAPGPSVFSPTTFTTPNALNNGSWASADRSMGTSYLRPPTIVEKQLFYKFWGTTKVTEPQYGHGTSTITANVDNYVVTAVKISSQSGFASDVQVNIAITSTDFNQYIVGQIVPGTVHYKTNVNFNVIDALDDAIRVGDANCDGNVNMGDVTAVERMILGYNGVTSNSILNNDGTVDMGTVVKIERIILGLK